MKNSAYFLSTWLGIVLLFVVFGAAIPTYAQQAAGSSLVDLQNLRLVSDSKVATTYLKVDKRYEGIRGTPFLLRGWSTGDILLTTNQRVKAVPLKFDLYNQQLMVRRPQGDSILLDLRNIQEFTLTDIRTLSGQASLHRFARFTDIPGHSGRTEFLELLHATGPYTLLKRSGKSMVKADYQQAYSSYRPYDELVDVIQYYLLSPQGTLTVIKPAVKSLVAAVPATVQEPLLAELKKATLRTETDLLNAVSQLNLLAATVSK
ncbi:hypothetical protein [Hymenobacter guriensis]|uniref:DUF4369 domain-containing protein n=1 Tax=Hymenobacter guriensis TaxID=2793065 RepID=A0ABS0L475_9BACT|nr:hypothetical protein [Hymenobacter guriensis]MBG8554884.1 hypothetical protein [Hymenobacter guriensis]